jgi:ferredoxin-NADP reductase
MASFTVKLKRRRKVAEDTIAFNLTKPSGFEFKAGQSVDLTLINPAETDGRGNTRPFSLASAPFEKDLMITTRMGNTAFKRIFNSLPLDTAIKMEGPFGNLTLHNKPDRPGVLLAGGIGITPFRSMVLQAAHDARPHELYLFYSNRRPEDAAFNDELREVETQNPKFKLIGIMTEMEKSSLPWNGEREHVSKAMLERYVANLQNAMFYIAGPPDMVATINKTLNGAGIDDDDIRSEEFSGY